MKALIVQACVFLAVFVAGCSNPSMSSVASAPSVRTVAKASKGIELYSWRSDEVWHFALLPGTNGMKPEWMVKAAPLTLAEVERRFAEYPEGECIFWQSGSGFGLPDSAIVQHLRHSAQKAKLDLSAP
jgi:hypothetical protein